MGTESHRRGARRSSKPEKDRHEVARRAPLPRSIFAVLIAISCFFGSMEIAGALNLPNECRTGSLPSGDPKYPDDQQILVCIPDAWNGGLILYAHGFVPVQAPLALPLDELTLADGRTVPEILLPLGFAFATSSYHKNGYAVEQGGADMTALLAHVKTLLPPNQLKKVYITGGSEGGLIATMLLERNPQSYSGGLALCAPIGGAPFQVQYLGDFRVAFNYFFPGIFPAGRLDPGQDAFQAWDMDVEAITAAIRADPSAANQLYSVTRAAVDPADPETRIATALHLLFYSVWETHDLLETAGGNPYDNRSRLYFGSVNDFRLNTNVERFAADPAAAAYMRQFYQPTGRLARPLVTLHTTLDDLVPFVHETLYILQVLRAGRFQQLTPLSVNRYGHCNFTAEEIIGAFGVMLLRTGGPLPPSLQEAAQVFGKM